MLTTREIDVLSSNKVLLGSLFKLPFILTDYTITTPGRHFEKDEILAAFLIIHGDDYLNLVNLIDWFSQLRTACIDQRRIKDGSVPSTLSSLVEFNTELLAAQKHHEGAKGKTTEPEKIIAGFDFLNDDAVRGIRSGSIKTVADLNQVDLLFFRRALV